MTILKFLKVGIVLYLLFSVNVSKAQNVNIPDANFKNALLDHGGAIQGSGISTIDTNGDGEISVVEAQVYTGTLNVSSRSISDLTGIEAFIYLTILQCSDNNLTSLDLGSNSSLLELYCHTNQLTSLDVSALTSLQRLYCPFNQITSLDVSSNSALQRLHCYENQLTSLNVANGNNQSLGHMWAHVNSGLTCIQTDANIVGTNPVNWQKDSGATYNADCSNASTCTNVVNIPDVNFKNALLSYVPAIDTDADGEICETEAQAFSGTLNVSFRSISDLTGIEAFTAITGLECVHNNLTSLDLSANTALISVHCYNNNLTNLNVIGNVALEILTCSQNQLTSLSLNSNTSLNQLSCNDNNLASLDLGSNTSFSELYCHNNQLTSLDLSGTSALIKLFCENNSLTSLNIANGNNSNMINMQATNNPELTCIQTDPGIVGTNPVDWSKDASASYSADCSVPSCSNIVSIPDANFKAALLDHGVGITGFYISVIDTDGDGEICENEAQAYTGGIDVSNKSISDLTGIEAFENLIILNCNSNALTNVDLSSNTALVELYCRINQLTSLSVSSNLALERLYCDQNQLSSLDVSSNTNLQRFHCDQNQIISLDLSGNTQLTNLICKNNALTSLNIANGENANLAIMHANNNFNLPCIQTDNDIVGTPPIGWQKDPTTTYSANCGYPVVLVTDITVSGSDISTNGGTSQMSAVVLPNNATNSSLSWSVDNSSIATIDETTGLLTAVSNGEVVVTASALDDSGVTGSLTVTISNQTVGIPEHGISFSIIPNPTSGKFKIETDTQINSVEISSISGQKVAFFETTECDLSELQAGIYYVNIISSQGITTSRIIKN